MNKKRFCRTAALSLMLFGIGMPLRGFSAKTIGRMTLGGVVMTERYKSEVFGSTSNDYLRGSGRIFYKVSEIGPAQWEFVYDLRDKHDFFGKLNKELLSLQGKNEFQVRQMSVRMVNPKGLFSAQFGRFELPEAGAVFVDGVEAELRLGPSWRTGLFAGLNPKSAETAALKLQTDAQQQGLFATYQAKGDGWSKNLYFSQGLVEQKYKGQSERSFLFHNLVYQWQENSRWISYLNYDLVPSKKIQTANLILQQELTKNYSTELGYILLDTPEYRRRQGLLEKIAPSPYKESRIEIARKTGVGSQIAIQASSGQRDVDQLKRTEVELGCSISDVFMENLDLRLKAGSRKNFTSKDSLVHFGLAYFSRKWEYAIDTQYEINANDDGSTTHPLTTEVSLSNVLGKNVYLTGSLQRAANEELTIFSTFVKVGYRFGSQEIPPIRDGAPPRGAL